ncbi:hypothetical protein ACW0KB_10575 [Virgibacillus salarius]
MSIKAAVLLHVNVVEPDNSEGRPRKGKWAAGVVVKQQLLFHNSY